MTRNISVVVGVGLVVLLTAGKAFAGPIGDTGTFRQTRVSGYRGAPNNGGGEFTAYDLNGLNNLSYADDTKNIVPALGDSFQTFCIEINEYTTNPMHFEVTSEARDGGAGGPSPDPISKGTAWLYSQFAQGVLALGEANPYDYAAGALRAADAFLLQEAIWALEEEKGDPIGGTNSFFDLVVMQFGGTAMAKMDAAAGYLGVYVLNNTTASGGVAQDFLYYTVPDGGATFALLGFALMGLGVARRKLRA